VKHSRSPCIPAAWPFLKFLFSWRHTGSASLCCSPQLPGWKCCCFSCRRTYPCYLAPRRPKWPLWPGMAWNWSTSACCQRNNRCQCRTPKNRPRYRPKYLRIRRVYFFNVSLIRLWCVFFVLLLLIILSMHFFFPMVGIAAKVRPIAQHLSLAAVQFAWRDKIILLSRFQWTQSFEFIENLFIWKHVEFPTPIDPSSIATKVH
jgi:hypothetical protein